MDYSIKFPRSYNLKEVTAKADYDLETNQRKAQNKLPLPSFFLSHNSKDKDKCRKIAEFFRSQGIYYYLDEEDLELQQYSEEKRHEEVTKAIERGISKCTHMICVYSEHTVNSKWVPFEIGYGRAKLASKPRFSTKDNNLLILILEGVKDEDIFEFLYTGRFLASYIELVEYLNELGLWSSRLIIGNQKQGEALNFVLPLRRQISNKWFE